MSNNQLDLDFSNKFYEDLKYIPDNIVENFSIQYEYIKRTKSVERLKCVEDKNYKNIWYTPIPKLNSEEHHHLITYIKDHNKTNSTEVIFLRIIEPKKFDPNTLSSLHLKLEFITNKNSD